MFRAEAAVEVAADAAVLGVAGHLADVVNMVHRVLKSRVVRLRDANDPALGEHPRIQRQADHRAALNQRLDLFVGQLPISRNQRPAVVVARQYRTLIHLQRFPERLIGQVRHVEDHAALIHLAQKRRPIGQQPPFAPGSVRIRADAVV